MNSAAGNWLTSIFPTPPAVAITNFNRYYFAQVGKKGAVMDERFNGGGQLADYIIDYLHRPVMSQVMTREGETVFRTRGSHLWPEGDDHQ